MIEPPSAQIPAVYHRRIGDIVITSLSDGVLFRDHEMMRDVSANMASGLLAQAFRERFVLSINAFLIYAAGRLALVDTGSGTYMGSDAGYLAANLKIAGVDPAQIDTILLTHMHPDHSAGLTDRDTGHSFFPKAELVVHENEPKHWFDDGSMARGSEREKKLMFQAARDQTRPYLDRMRTISGNEEVFPGVSAVLCPGHTPGHTAYLVNSGAESMLIWGDTVHMPEVQIPHPEVSMVVDVDPILGVASRRRMLDFAATDRLLVAGMHLHYPGLGYIARQGDAYRCVPEPWAQGI